MKRLATKGAGLAETQPAVVPPRQAEGAPRESRDRGLPRSGLAFPGCYARPMTVLSRVGRALREREGTGPEDDPLLRQQRAETIFKMVVALLRQRGIAPPADSPSGLGRRLDALKSASEERVIAAASAADSFADFLARLDDPGS